MSIQQLTGGLRQYFRVPSAEGVLVSTVHKNTPAERAGLRAGDVILAVNGRTVADHSSLLGALETLEPGGVAHLRVMRERAERSVDVTVEERPRPERCEGVEQLRYRNTFEQYRKDADCAVGAALAKALEGTLPGLPPWL